MNYTTEQLNDNSMLVRFGSVIDKNLPPIIAQCSQYLEAHFAQFILDQVPSYTTLLIVFDTERISAKKFKGLVEAEISTCLRQGIASSFRVNRVEIPVFYDASVAPDLERMALSRKLSVDDVISMHSSPVYTVFTIGFLPGFAYLGTVDERIAEPRIATPRPRVIAGSVGIAGEQTGVYPLDSPGGWNIIGRTPLKVLNVNEAGEVDCVFAVGDEVCFKPIARKEFDRLSRQYSQGLTR